MMVSRMKNSPGQLNLSTVIWLIFRALSLENIFSLDPYHYITSISLKSEKKVPSATITLDTMNLFYYFFREREKGTGGGAEGERET